MATGAMYTATHGLAANGGAADLRREKEIKFRRAEVKAIGSAINLKEVELTAGRSIVRQCRER